MDDAIAARRLHRLANDPLIAGLPFRHFRCVLADPPWNFKSNSADLPGRNARRHYDCMDRADIISLPVTEFLRDDAVLFLWITGPMLVIGAHLPVMRAWGFEPSGMGFVWTKTTKDGTRFAFGGGFTTRKSTEFCLIGKRGASTRRNAGIYEAIISPRREHSRKPDGIHKRIERYTAGPYLELFGRQQRDGWIVRGNESSKFEIEEEKSR